MGLGDVIVPTGSAYNYGGGIYTQYLGGFMAYPAVPDYHLMSELIRSLETAGLKPWVAQFIAVTLFMQRRT
ncbi:hypothetical protein [Vulcanisaeta souniana]|uniref:hypothetical protein n=1 Tax=Vulcanisaeta souniana TaxID=164452 RepID=UPI000B2860A6|nr:hypothetical protein [Vulcanisaeta souniana]